MSGDIVLSSALRNNLLSLQNTQRNIDTTQLRLATGLRVNSALDNPQNFFTAQALNNRAGDLTRLLDGISQSIRTIEQANTGVETLQNLLDQADAIALDAQSEIRASEGFARTRGNEDLTGFTDLIADSGGAITATTNAFDVTVIGADGVDAAVVNITITAGDVVDDIVAQLNSDVTFAGVATARVTNSGFLEIASDVENQAIRIEGAAANSVDAAGFAFLGLDTVVGPEDGNGAVRQGGTAIAGNTIISAQSAAPQTNGEFEASAQLTDAAGGAGFIAAGDNVDLALVVDGTRVDLGTIADTDSIQAVLDAVNNSGRSDIEATFNTTTGRIEIEADETIGQIELEFTANTAGDIVSFGFGGDDADATLGAIGDAVSTAFTFDGVNPDVDQFEEDFNNIRDQIDQLVEDSNYRGVNLLSSDNLETFFNEDRSNSLETEGVDFTALGLGITVGDFTNARNVQVSIDQIRAATADVRNFGQSIANDLSVVQFRRDFTEQTINTLQSGADDLTVADQNEEGANLLALQTRQALGTTSLSLAAQSQQAVLRLF
ncbi:MAG: flagellin [Pseudomonadota bacterium]